jgi:hypothetical protein
MFAPPLRGLLGEALSGTSMMADILGIKCRHAARQAASEIAGNLGAPCSWQISKDRAGLRNLDKSSGWRDDELGHPEFGARPHVNAWNKENGIFQ